MDKKKQSVKRNKHVGGKVAGSAALLALLLAGGHFGLGIGREGGGLLTGQAWQEATETIAHNAQSAREVIGETVEGAKKVFDDATGRTQETVEVTVASLQDDGVLTVMVQEDKLLYEGEAVTMAQLEERLLRDFKGETTPVELRDDHAIKAAYDEVHALLQKLSIPFTTGK